MPSKTLEFELSVLGDCDFLTLPFDFDTPDTDGSSPLLATPIPIAAIHDTTRIETPRLDMYAFESIIETPSAPVIKDLDSFTEGTGGSFDFSGDDDDEIEQGDLVAHPGAYDYNDNDSINRSVQEWVNEVSESNAPWVATVNLPDDPVQMEMFETTEAMLGGFTIDVEELEDIYSIAGYGGSVGGGGGPQRMPSAYNLVPPKSAPAVAMTPRVMKRARSQSPASQYSRHVRSRSLSSIGGLPSDLSTMPPWRSTQPFKD